MSENGVVMKNCIRCKAMFYYSGVGNAICSNCREIDADEFRMVKEYIYDNPGATIIEVSDATDIPVAQIEGYLRVGRLEIPKNSPIFIKCEQCKRDIRFGRFCESCASSMSDAVKKKLHFDSSHVGEIAPTEAKKARMHFLDRNNERERSMGTKNTQTNANTKGNTKGNTGSLEKEYFESTDKVIRERLDRIVEQRREKDRRNQGW